MEYRQLGCTDLKVSALCLGTMTFGEQNTEAEGHAQFDRALDAGINFFDTAEIYPVPPIARTQGLTESYIGNWLKKRSCRDRVIIASKVAGDADWIDYLRDGNHCLDRKNIEAAVDGSLQRLATDVIDIYQLHWPDRKTNFFGKLGYEHPQTDTGAPIVESLEVMGDLVKAGKIRYVGISNETPWGMMQYLRLADEMGLPRIASIQNPYSLLNRTIEIALSEMIQREDVSLLAYSPLAFGTLSGKYLVDPPPQNVRITLHPRFSRYSKPEAMDATRAYVNLAREHGLDPAQMALAFVISRQFVTSTILGATSMEQLESNLASFELTLSPEVVEGIEAIHQQQPNPSP